MSNFRIKAVSNFIFFVIFYVFSYFIIGAFTGGDQEHYNYFYDNVSGNNISDAFVLYENSLGSSEPVYFLIIFLISDFFSKNIFISLVNAYFSLLFLRLLIVKRVSLLVIFLLFSNFYFFVLLFSAERLKFALLFILISFFSRGLLKKTFLFLSLFTQAQVFLIILSQLSNFVVDFIYRLKILKVRKSDAILTAIVPIVVAASCWYVLGEHIFAKFTYYVDVDFLRFGLLKIFFFLFLAIYYSPRKIETFIAFVPIVIAGVFFGTDRVLIFAYFIFLYYALDYNRGLNFPVILTGSYFTLRGVYFIYTSLLYGDGFYCIYGSCQL